MHDILPSEVARWHRVERVFRETFERAGYREVRTPIAEATSLFVRSIGDATDVVEKEMYSFTRHDDELTLRPEGTAGAARAYLEHRVHAREPVSRWYYLGPMFRGERPARGRQRQFYQAGAELYGDPGPLSDADTIDSVVRLLQALGVGDVVAHVNSLGSGETRARYRDALVSFLTPVRGELSDESQRRFDKNPLRILDSKSPHDQALCAGAPSILDVLADEDRAHWDGLRRHLDALGTPYVVDPRLVRGLDYYTRTLFEVKTSAGELGAQNALGGGGRYDRMVGELGGPETPCIGFALGLERILLAMPAGTDEPPSSVYVIGMGDRGQTEALLLCRELRARGLTAILDGRGGKLKTMLHRADSAGASHAILVGDGELERGVVALKDLAAHAQEDVPRAGVVERLASRLSATRIAR